MTGTSVGDRVERALAAAKMSQRTLAARTKISQPTLSRIISGGRAAKMPELVAIAWVTGVTVAELTGSPTIADRVQCAARATNGADMETMCRTLLHYLELDAYLDDQTIPAA